MACRPPPPPPLNRIASAAVLESLVPPADRMEADTAQDEDAVDLETLLLPEGRAPAGGRAAQRRWTTAGGGVRSPEQVVWVWPLTTQQTGPEAKLAPDRNRQEAIV